MGILKNIKLIFKMFSNHKKNHLTNIFLLLGQKKGDKRKKKHVLRIIFFVLEIQKFIEIKILFISLSLLFLTKYIFFSLFFSQNNIKKKVIHFNRIHSSSIVLIIDELILIEYE